MRTSFVMASVLLLPLVAAAQQKVVSPPPPPPQGSNWQHVQALPLGTTIQVKTPKSKTKCALKSVDADSLTCLRGKDIVFQRTEIRSITIPRRTRSTWVGTAIGGGVGFGLGTGAAAATDKGGWFSGAGWDALSGALLGLLGAGIGAGVGAGTDFTHSTIYKAP
jgi:hypothetical protein